MRKEYYARSKNHNGEKQTVAEHIRGVRQLCEQYTMETIGSDVPGNSMGSYHDLGKISDLFQGVLAHTETHVDHALPGSAVMAYLNIVLSNKKKEPLSPGFNWRCSPAWPSICAVRNHHGKLNWYCDEEIKQYMRGELVFERKPAFPWISKARKEALEYYKSHEILWKEKDSMPEYLDQKDPRELMLYTRMLFSSLVDADYSDAARHEDTMYLENASVPMFDPEESWEKLCAIRQELIEKTKERGEDHLPINRIRNQVFEACVAAGEKIKNGIFTMTAPTGSAKTFGMAAFALKELARADNAKKRVIVVLPYHTIIEQNAKVFRQFIPDVTEIHGQAETIREISSRWDAPFIVTTSVQFFESLFACEGPRCRKLHRFANAVILFDECQTLPCELAGETVTALRILAEHYNSTILFSSGTQPRFDTLRGYEAISGWKPKEIISNVKEIFLEARRVEVKWKLDIMIEDIIEEFLKQKDACMIVNLRRHALFLYNSILQKLGTNENLYLLTASMPPAQRSEILREVEQKREDGIPCMLIATQCIEAGVDISFPYMYRALAPLEAVIQAAGRCNRHGEYGMGHLVVFRFEEEGKTNYPATYYEIAARTTEAIYTKHGESLDIYEEDIIQEYFHMLYNRSISDGNHKLKKAVEEMDFEKVQEIYHLIPDTSVNVVTPYDEQAFTELEKAAINGINNKWIRKAVPYTVSVYNREMVENTCEQLYVRKLDGSLFPVPYYLCSNRELFDKKKGLLLQ